MLVDHRLDLGDLGRGVAIGVEDLKVDLHAQTAQAVDLGLDLVLGLSHPGRRGVDGGPADFEWADVGYRRESHPERTRIAELTGGGDGGGQAADRETNERRVQRPELIRVLLYMYIRIMRPSAETSLGRLDRRFGVYTGRRGEHRVLDQLILLFASA